MNIQYYRSSDEEDFDNTYKKNKKLSSRKLKPTNDNEVEVSSILKPKDNMANLVEEQNQVFHKINLFSIINKIYFYFLLFFKITWIFFVALFFFFIGFYASKNSIALPTSFYPVNNFVLKKHIPKSLVSFKKKFNYSNIEDAKTVMKKQAIEVQKPSYEVLSLKEKEQVINSIKDLIFNYKETIKPVSPFTIELKTFLGYQIINKKTNLSLPSQSDETSLSSRFDQVVDQNINQVDINTQRNLYSIIYVLNKITKFGFLKLKHDIKIKPLAMFGICFNYKIK